MMETDGKEREGGGSSSSTSREKEKGGRKEEAKEAPAARFKNPGEGFLAHPRKRELKDEYAGE